MYKRGNLHSIRLQEDHIWLNDNQKKTPQKNGCLQLVLFCSQVCPHQSAGAGTLLMVWPSCPSVVRCTSGSTVVLTLDSPSIKKPTPSCQTSASSGGTPLRKANWCLDIRTEVCPFFNQVGHKDAFSLSWRKCNLKGFCSCSYLTIVFALFIFKSKNL